MLWEGKSSRSVHLCSHGLPATDVGHQLTLQLLSFFLHPLQVQELAAELGLDRSQVLHWMKEFALKPDS
jgi:predicted transcriptional regulator